MSSLLTQDFLQSILDYDPDTGVFSWTENSRGKRRKSHAGSIKNDGYVAIGIRGKYYKAHRLAWLYVHGAWPEDAIDHINRDRSDNRVSNLRECSLVDNQMNRSAQIGSSARKGVSFDRKSGKWTSGIRLHGKYIYLGRYETEEEAHAVYCLAAWRFFGEFACYN
ncbi:HNH endonuclease [Serratia proteamaculans]|uniref:HNH endonuclease n=1 Tax=Serratia proteamaculans TaxID=28151 RepID=UPI001021BFEA|nr:HNH endonuclease [Serratia proteamaculans]RYM55654.1 hypothetical protein BSQ96_02825 [Serratia proteamaculans]